MQILVGTSGYSYKEWKGSFYPEKIKHGEMLPYYAERFSAVEINNTFYRMPKASVLRGWAAQRPPDFLFVLKASQQITHRKRLKEAGEPFAYLLEVATALGPKLGPVLFQLPPSFKKDIARLRDFLGLSPWSARSPSSFVTRPGPTTRSTRSSTRATAPWCAPTPRTRGKRGLPSCPPPTGATCACVVV